MYSLQTRGGHPITVGWCTSGLMAVRLSARSALIVAPLKIRDAQPFIRAYLHTVTRRT